MRQCALLILASLPALAEDKFQFPVPAANQLAIQTVQYRGKLAFDLYRPAKSSARLPVAIFLNGIGADWIRKHPGYTGWASLATTVGYAGIAMDSDPADVAGSFEALMSHLRENAAGLRVDPERVLLYSCSGNARAGWSIAEDPARKYIRAAIIYYGVGTAPAVRTDLPLLLVRAGLDRFELNREIDQNASKLLAENAPLTLISYASGVHAFDVRQPGAETKAVIEQTLAFMRRAVGAEADARGSSLSSAAAHGYQGRWNEAVAAYRALRARQPTDAGIAEKLGEALVATGDLRGALAEYAAAVDLGSPNRGLISYSAAVAAVRLGDNDLALKWLARLKDIPWMRSRVLSEPAFEPLRGDPRFSSLSLPSAN